MILKITLLTEIEISYTASFAEYKERALNSHSKILFLCLCVHLAFGFQEILYHCCQGNGGKSSAESFMSLKEKDVIATSSLFFFPISALWLVSSEVKLYWKLKYLQLSRGVVYRGLQEKGPFRVFLWS